VFHDVFAVQRCGGAAADDVETIFEPAHGDEAPAFGVLAALEHAGTRCVVLAVDYPTVTADALRILAARTAASSAALIAPRWEERLQTLFAGYDAPRVAPRLASRIAEGRLDLHGLADGIDVEIIDLPPLRNVNTPQELEEAMRPS